ncbi:unnamed protein product [Peniophora sp. CBMAI 1063]|nr:unnamed protein product [Peniophora sp. CBMAI 1063]
MLGPLPHDLDEAGLSSFLSACGDIVHVRIRRHARTGASLRYGYATFSSRQSVDEALKLGGKVMDGQPVSVRALVRHVDEVHVRGLSWDVNEEELKRVFEHCGKVVRATIRSTKHGRVKRDFHGFVQFESPKSASKAFADMSGTKLHGRSLTVTLSMPRSTHVLNSAKQGDDRAPTAVMIKHLPPQVDDDWLRTTFEGCGEIVMARVQRHFRTADSPGTGNSLGFGYINFASPASAENALQMHGLNVAGHTLHIETTPGLAYSSEQ